MTINRLKNTIGKREAAFTIVFDNAGMGRDGLFSAFEVALSMKGDARN